MCSKNISEADELKEIAYKTVEMARMTPIGDFAVSLVDGDNTGASCLVCVVPLKESHLSIHTWPEHNFVSIDLYTCGDREAAMKAFFHLVDYFKAGNEDIWELERSFVS
jgi:S-adenosylmethionine decarboxylase